MSYRGSTKAAASNAPVSRQGKPNSPASNAGVDQLSAGLGRLNVGTKSRQSLDDVPSPAARPPSFTRNGAPSAPLPAAPAVEPEKLKSAARSMYYFQTSLEDAAHRYKVPVALLSAYFSDRTAEFVLDNAIPDFSEDRLRKAAAAVYFKGLGIKAAAKKYMTAQTDLKLFYDQHAAEWLMQTAHGSDGEDSDDGLDDFYA